VRDNVVTRVQLRLNDLAAFDDELRNRAATSPRITKL